MEEKRKYLETGLYFGLEKICLQTMRELRPFYLDGNMGGDVKIELEKDNIKFSFILSVVGQNHWNSNEIYKDIENYYSEVINEQE